jgi:hypothetical protein
LTDLVAAGRALLESGIVPDRRAESPSARGPQPVALDRNGAIGAVSFAARNRTSSLERDAWSCIALMLQLIDGRWLGGDEQDASWTPHPFERPVAAENSRVSWIDWHSNGPLRWVEGQGWCHCLFGIAPLGTARLLVRSDVEAPRDLAITQYNGAYVAAVIGERSWLAGFDETGRELGEIQCQDGPNDWSP